MQMQMKMKMTMRLVVEMGDAHVECCVVHGYDYAPVPCLSICLDPSLCLGECPYPYLDPCCLEQGYDSCSVCASDFDWGAYYSSMEERDHGVEDCHVSCLHLHAVPCSYSCFYVYFCFVSCLMCPTFCVPSIDFDFGFVASSHSLVHVSPPSHLLSGSSHTYGSNGCHHCDHDLEVECNFLCRVPCFYSFHHWTRVSGCHCELELGFDFDFDFGHG